MKPDIKITFMFFPFLSLWLIGCSRNYIQVHDKTILLWLEQSKKNMHHMHGQQLEVTHEQRGVELQKRVHATHIRLTHRPYAVKMKLSYNDASFKPIATTAYYKDNHLIYQMTPQTWIKKPLPVEDQTLIPFQHPDHLLDRFQELIKTTSPQSMTILDNEQTHYISILEMNITPGSPLEKHLIQSFILPYLPPSQRVNVNKMKVVQIKASINLHSPTYQIKEANWQIIFFKNKGLVKSRQTFQSKVYFDGEFTGDIVFPR